MPDTETIISGHYQAIRAEIIERIKLRDQYVIWLAAVFSGSLGVFTSNKEWWGFLIGVPIMAMIAGILYAHTDLTLNSLGRWLRDIYGATLEEYCCANGIRYPLEFWDHSPKYKDYSSSMIFGFRYWSTAFIILGLGLVSTILVSPHLATSIITPWHYVIIVLLSILSLVGAISPVVAWWTRRGGK